MICIGCERINKRRKKSKSEGIGYKTCRGCKRDDSDHPTTTAFEREKAERRAKKPAFDSPLDERRWLQRHGCYDKKGKDKHIKPITQYVVPKVHNRDVNGRESERYHEWRDSILKRDKRRCILCGEKEWLNVHHIERWIDNIERRYDLRNGVTLCIPCHTKHHGPQMQPFPKTITERLTDYIETVYGG